ncbi:DNA-directed RNA polymerase subunit alpha C-terminal domain-containing protein [Variovorax sp. J31P179]|uniref:DNA-directed RNA polymerase subunit alpha C-terminal domain-containing protein n=1 Tax=Variovorax sp. J31P179 TaxID=3053508 RepID=UPI002574E374|nr:DNA-directed RNA polymerase subunit alpha C-terminal domain-containing protein [Variovorax sp. J31P179]MDM0084854.1 DNA-directed RNA polymerase subunit alpha C-terminal domain-containing protein [Variovorax sp. J31P179]
MNTITTLNDLAQLPDGELVACLSGIRAAIHKAKQAHAKAQAEGRAPPPVHLPAYVWRARPSSHRKPRPDMPIDDLGMRVSISSALKELGIVYLEDLAEIDEQELLGHDAIGVRTVARLRDALQQAGLGFRRPTGQHAGSLFPHP